MSRHPSLLPAAKQKKAQHFFASKEEYEKRLLEAQRAVLDVQARLRKDGGKLILVFEGADAAGKGGVIQRLAQHLDPRDLEVHPTRAPDATEAGQHYWQRFFAKLPGPGKIAVFDRSWYGRVLVERVEGFARKKAWSRAYGEINAVEKMLRDDGIRVLKYLLDVSYKEQKRRFEEREEDPLKSWKITDDDYRNRGKWEEYVAAFGDMLKRTSPRACPWTVVPADSKWYARVRILEDISRRA